MWRASRSSSTSRNSSPDARHAAPPEDLRPASRDRPRRPLRRSRPASRGSCSSSCPQTRASPTASVPRCTSTVATGPRPLSRCASITVPRAWPVGIALQLLEVGDQQERLEEGVEVHLRAWRRRRRTRPSPPHSDGTTPCSTIWVRTRFGSASSLSILLTATTIGTSAAFAWSSASSGLRHHAVVGRHDEHGDVGDLRAAGAHRGERLVARGVDERDVAVAHVRLVRADVLGDAAELAGDDVGLADRVEQLRLAVVDVAHDGDDRRPRHQLRLVDLLLDQVLGRDLVLDARRSRPRGPARPRRARSRRRTGTWWPWPSRPP